MKSHIERLILIAACLSLFSPPVHAELFTNAYISFELPSNWKCKLEATEWVCVSKFKKTSKEAIIILTAKEVGPNDTLSAYAANLKTPRTLPTKEGKTKQSKVMHVRQRQLNGHLWIDSLHLGSEVSTYYTRYLVTVKDKIAILVTFSAHQRHYTKYVNSFLQAVNSLRVVASKDLMQGNPSVDFGQTNETIGSPITATLPSELIGEEIDVNEDSSGSIPATETGAIILILLAAIGYYIYRKRKS